jgi:hypothetical protein
LSGDGPPGELTFNPAAPPKPCTPLRGDTSTAELEAAPLLSAPCSGSIIGYSRKVTVRLAAGITQNLRLISTMQAIRWNHLKLLLLHRNWCAALHPGSGRGRRRALSLELPSSLQISQHSKMQIFHGAILGRQNSVGRVKLIPKLLMHLQSCTASRPPTLRKMNMRRATGSSSHRDCVLSRLRACV